MNDLDRQVAEVQGWKLREEKWPGYLDPELWWWGEGQKLIKKDAYSPSTNWKQTGELIDKFDLLIVKAANRINYEVYQAFTVNHRLRGYDKDKKRAICKAVIAMHG